MLLLSLLFGCGAAPESPVAVLELQCGNGDQEACFQLGVKQLNSPQPDYGVARNLFATGCGVHHGPSCNALGTLVRDARGGPKDMVRARKLFETACENGSNVGCVHQADILSGLEKQNAPEKAVKLYGKACEGESGIPKACTELGKFTLEGFGTERDPEAAMALFEKACKADYAPSCVEIADLLQQKWGKDNMQRATELLDKACAIDANFGCYELAVLHHRNKAPDANIEQAGHFYSRICSHDQSRGCYELAELMASGDVPSRPGEKEALYKRACESGNSDACSKR